jgi:hypothetical protein
MNNILSRDELSELGAAGPTQARLLALVEMVQQRLARRRYSFSRH